MLIKGSNFHKRMKIVLFSKCLGFLDRHNTYLNQKTATITVVSIFAGVSVFFAFSKIRSLKLHLNYSQICSLQLLFGQYKCFQIFKKAPTYLEFCCNKQWNIFERSVIKFFPFSSVPCCFCSLANYDKS